MDQIITIIEQNGNKAVSARELYTFLQRTSNFTTWCKRMFEYGFEEGLDFIPFLEENPKGRPRKDYALSLDCAKEISMLQRNEKGKQARRYFIAVEKKAKEMVQAISPAEQLLQNAQILVQQEKRLEEHDSRLKELEARTSTKPDYFTIAGYGNLNDIVVNLKLASRLGRVATKLCKERGYITDQIPDPRFGRVKMYPKSILSEVFSTVNV